ncbi:hypothetical protein QTI51_22985 [Variovorax sp. J22G73]|uniref:hypothetical protein n=1 Tax=unclassified Variovorax TaxID=663243 RepID=UPI00257896A5|nr:MULTISPECIES: hypothetical protein [unclassified Variovorax]MDM0007472.1 hypothetical protein [Variovorax sp. J22R203]MDM0100168.1 hypothetical protein [Variovorax sp. J22G73]
MTLPLLLMLAVALVFFYWAYFAFPRKIRTRREELLREQGQTSGAAFFPVDPRRMLGDWDGTCILFDPDARKACIVSRGKKARTVDFHYFQTWQLLWTEYPENPLFRFQHVHFLFETSDFDRPTIRVAVPSKSDGEAWNAKLSILMP